MDKYDLHIGQYFSALWRNYLASRIYTCLILTLLLPALQSFGPRSINVTRNLQPCGVPKDKTKQLHIQHAVGTSETTHTAIDVFQKGKVFPVHGRKAYWESWVTAPLILNLGTRWRWVSKFSPRPPALPQRKDLVPTSMRLGGPQSRSGRLENRHILALAGILTEGPPGYS
jgi:hypothetical protein